MILGNKKFAVIAALVASSSAFSADVKLNLGETYTATDGTKISCATPAVQTNLNAIYTGFETGESGVYSASPAAVNLQLVQDGELVTGTYTVDRSLVGLATYQVTAQLDGASGLKNVQMFAVSSIPAQQGAWGAWGQGTMCQVLVGKLDVAADGKLISGTLSPVNEQASPYCKVKVSVSKKQAPCETGYVWNGQVCVYTGSPSTN